MPIALSVLVLLADGVLRFDFLMPAELFLFALIGGGLLLWASWRAGSRRRPIGWGLAAMVGLLVAGQALAILTGLASGETEPAGWPLVLVVASLVGYTLALVAVGIAGVLLVRDLFRQGEHDD